VAVLLLSSPVTSDAAEEAADSGTTDLDAAS
jgi:hypothetical protein